MVCRSCKRDNPEGEKYCQECGEFLFLDDTPVASEVKLPKDADRTKVRTARRKAIAKLAGENPDMAARVLGTWLDSE